MIKYRAGADILAIADLGQKLSFYNINGKQVTNETSVHK